MIEKQADSLGVSMEEHLGRQGHDVIGTDDTDEIPAETIARTGETVNQSNVRTGTDLVEARKPLGRTQEQVSEDVRETVEASTTSAREISNRSDQIAGIADDRVSDLNDVCGEIDALSRRIDEAESADELADVVSATIDDVEEVLAEIRTVGIETEDRIERIDTPGGDSLPWHDTGSVRPVGDRPDL